MDRARSSFHKNASARARKRLSSFREWVLSASYLNLHSCNGNEGYGLSMCHWLPSCCKKKSCNRYIFAARLYSRAICTYVSVLRNYGYVPSLWSSTNEGENITIVTRPASAKKVCRTSGWEFRRPVSGGMKLTLVSCFTRGIDISLFFLFAKSVAFHDCVNSANASAPSLGRSVIFYENNVIYVHVLVLLPTCVRCTFLERKNEKDTRHLLSETLSWYSLIRW